MLRRVRHASVGAGLGAHGCTRGSRMVRPTVLTFGKQTRRQQFQPHTRRNGARHVGQRGVHRVGHHRESVQTKRFGLAAQLGHILTFGGIGQHAFRAISRQGEHHEVAHAGQQILDETTRIETAHHDLLHHVVKRFAITVDHRVDALADQRIRRETEQRHGSVMCDDTVDGSDHQLIKHGQGVAHGTAACTHGQPEHAGFGLDVFLLADLF